MRPIVHPLNPNDHGPEVFNLQDGLLLLLSRRVIQVSDSDLPGYEEAVRNEQREQTYGEYTAKVVRIFREQNGLESFDAVDERTASLLNRILKDLGALGSDPMPRFYIVSGQIVLSTGEPFKAGVIRAWNRGFRLGQDISDSEGRYTIRYEQLPGDNEIELHITVSSGDDDLLLSSEPITAAQPIEIVNLTLPVANSPSKQHRIEGRILLEHGLPAQNLKLRLYRHDFGGTETSLKETTTDEYGIYSLPYDAGDRSISLSVRAVDSEGREIPLSKILYDIAKGKAAVLNLVAPSALQPLATEYQRLTEDLTPYVGEMGRLANASENAERQDLSILNRNTGWDARLIAMAATAANLSADPQVGLSQEIVYGLLRAGLPSDKFQLGRVSVETVEQALLKVHESGIINLNGQMAEVKDRFETFYRDTRLAMLAPGSNATYGQLLEATGLNEEIRNKFATLYFKHGGQADQLWEQAHNEGIGKGPICVLQQQGKLAYLTGNNPALTTSLKQGIPDIDRLQSVDKLVASHLVDQNLFKADSWINKLYDAAGIRPERRNEPPSEDEKQRLQALIPPAFSGETVEARLNAYAEDMARKVRLSYPTQVVTRMVELDTNDTFQLNLDPAARTATITLLKNASALGFKLGQTPLQAFIQARKDDVISSDIAEEVKTKAIETTKTLYRAYQLTPSNAAMEVLLKEIRLTSAYDIAEFSLEAFVDRYGHLFPSPKEAELVHRKAQQISSTIYNLFTIAKKLDSATSTAGTSASVAVQKNVRNELLKQYPTMESLFGSMDFCECEQCRSVLSPAAYLVSLLQFIDYTESGELKVWENFLDRWKKKHNEDYTTQYKKPYDALIERRPDLPHIPLTCENTNTALPYIDIVNEILEYYVAHDKLEAKAAHDTGEATTTELLAEPQNVIGEAYEKLQLSRYPLALPFDLWIETVRSFSNYFETPLWKLLELFRSGDELFEPTQAYDRAAIFIESLQLSPTEFDILTEPNPLQNDKWYELYGYTLARPIIQNPTNVLNAAVLIPDAEALKFNAGDICTYFDISTNTLQTETKTISAIGNIGSGGAGMTEVRFEGIWATPPKQGDLIVFAATTVLESAKALSRRLGVTYKEITDIVQTGFVNPKLTGLVILYKLGISIQNVFLYKNNRITYAQKYQQNEALLSKEQDKWTPAEKDQFNAITKDDWKILVGLHAAKKSLEHLIARYPASGLTVESLATRLNNIPFDEILVLADPDAGCDFDKTTLKYASGKAADEIVFLKINLFVRLWRKLGWSIEETDRALQVFIPENTPFDSSHLNSQPLKTALIYLAHLKALDGQVKIGEQSRLKLLTLWSQMTTKGKNPLYAQLFLTRSSLKSGEVFDEQTNQNISIFDHPLGDYLDSSYLAAISERVQHEVSQAKVEPADRIDGALFENEKPRLTLNYDPLREVQHLSYRGVLTDVEKTRLKTLVSDSTTPASLTLASLLDAVQKKAQEFMLIKSHQQAIQGALSLSADEIRLILIDANKSIDTSELSLENVSLLYRYGLLAKALKQSVRELITLKRLSGRDPFKQLDPALLTSLANDYPFTETLRFVEVSEQVKESGLKIEDLDYLLRHRFDETGKYRPNREATLGLLKTLAEGIRAIQAEHAVPEDPGTMSDEVLQQKLALVLPSDVVERLLAMMNGTVEFTATAKSDTSLPPEGFAEEPSILQAQIKYNNIRQEQKLTFRGVLFDAQKTALLDKLPKPVPPTPHVRSPLLEELLNKVQEQARSFFRKYLEKQPINVQPTSGFLDSGDFDLLFNSNLPLDPNETEQDRIRKQQTKLAYAFLPFLQKQLIRQLVVQTLTTQTGADPALVESLLTDSRLLGDPQTLVEAMSKLGEIGVSATFFSTVDGTGNGQKINLSDVDTSLKDIEGKPLKPEGTNSARFEGYLEVPTPGAYRFNIELDKQNASAELRFYHLPEPLFLNGSASSANALLGNEPEKYLELKSGVLYRFSLNLQNLDGDDARLLVQGETLPKDTVAQIKLYPANTVDRAEHAHTLLSKTLLLIQSLNLNEREVRYLLMHAPDFDGLDLKNLPARDAQLILEAIAKEKQKSDPTLTNEQAILNARTDNPELATEADRVTPLFNQFLRLASYTHLKRDLVNGSDDLIGIFESPTDRTYSSISKLTRRDENTVMVTAKLLFGLDPKFKSEKPLQRLWDALQVIERFGVVPDAITEWTRIVSPTSLSKQRFDIARNLKETIKSRFEPIAWQRVAQPIFDKLRQRQRDALVAHTMHQHKFVSMEQLYEYFLIDPGMEPVVQTSRIRLAISSVQLFIQRCLLNLEKQVPPAAIINAKQWKWMKRYRVWEANRRIFLFPENWLEPEFRDDKTYLFAELEGALLQGDVSSDLVEDAFLNYLKKLDEIAKLDIVAMHFEDQDDPAQNTLHVIGRTTNPPHKYFYRRYAHQMWTPWEPVTAEIEGDHLAPVIWRDRLFLFWVTFMDKADTTPEMGTKTAGQTLAKASLSDMVSDIKAAGTYKQVEVQLHWSEYVGGQWSTRKSGGFLPVMYRVGDDGSSAEIPMRVPSNYDYKTVFMYVSKEYKDNEERGVTICLVYGSRSSLLRNYFPIYLSGRNSIPERTNSTISQPGNPYNANNVISATKYSGSGSLQVNFIQSIITEGGKPPVPVPAILPIIQQSGPFTLLPCNNDIDIAGNPEIAKLIKPVFYQNNDHTFFIEPNLIELTIEEFKDWILPPPQADPGNDSVPWRDLPPRTQQPGPKVPILNDRGELWTSPINAESIRKINPSFDWLINPITALRLGRELIGPSGRLEAVEVPSSEISSVANASSLMLKAHPGSDMTPSNTLIAASNALKNAGLMQSTSGLNIVGRNGFNSSLAGNVKLTES
ncbi:hypothetical protein H6F89_30255 [Cyanobacteria bacterium FACHB-63]|nr:hypothetical protein [Cyanobacteria bacterium FACHB-63]